MNKVEAEDDSGGDVRQIHPVFKKRDNIDDNDKKKQIKEFDRWIER